MPARNFIGFDHVVLRCADVETTLRWYVDVLGLAPERVEDWRAGAAPFPSVRVSPDTIIDLVPASGPGSAAGRDGNVDHICLVADRATVDAISSERSTFRLVGEPGRRSGARGDGWSVYVRDPDDTVVEIRHYEG